MKTNTLNYLMIPSLSKHHHFKNLTQCVVNHPNVIGRGRRWGGKGGQKWIEEVKGEEKEWGGKGGGGESFFLSSSPSPHQNPHTHLYI